MKTAQQVEKPEGIFDDTRGYKKTAIAESGEKTKTAEQKFATLANTFSVSRCIYCEGKNIVKRGKRKKKHESVQLYLCQDCNRTFTGQKIKGKQYPARLILDGVSYYNVGFSYEQSARFLELSYGLKADAATLAGWVKEFADVCAYGRMRAYGLKLFSPNQIIQSSKMMHRQMYHFRYHRAKMALVLEEYKHYRFAALKELLNSVVDECPHQLFRESKRSSEMKAKFNLDQVRITEKRNYAVLLAELVLQAVTDNKLRHETLQKFMIANDSVTVATELPIYLDKEDVRYMREELKFEIPFEVDQYLTGHIDMVQVRNGAIHILDYKPNAKKENAVTQLMIYALALSRLTGLRLYEFRCAWFDDKNYYEFFPLHVVLKKKVRNRKTKKPPVRVAF
ncbi:MAG: PD-(D/E)XK nuclease family protein [Candidatus Sungbacteria bacterium]|nr:PD-(D/E)XK nuclease family protein [Candidatus Sungbacteria bacterium]